MYSYNKPSIELIERIDNSNKVINQAMLESMGKSIESSLRDYGINGKIISSKSGSVITTFNFLPARGVRVKKVLDVTSDLARSLAVEQVRIASVSGTQYLGIEVPNIKRKTVSFYDILNSNKWKHRENTLDMVLGEDIEGNPVTADLATMPHLLVAGTTGSGKSVGINAMLSSLLMKESPENLRLILIDPKVLEFSIYADIPHLLTPVVTDPKNAIQALQWACDEMDYRYKILSNAKVRNIINYNQKMKDMDLNKHMCHIVIIIDEMADLMMTGGKEVEKCVMRLAQKARASGIHLIMATQRPSVDVITGTIKANFPSRIAFSVSNSFDSKTIIGMGGAEKLLGKGDMLYVKDSNIRRIHAPYVSDGDVERIVNDIKLNGKPDYINIFGDTDSENKEAEIGLSPIIEKGLYLVKDYGILTVPFLQRRLLVSFEKAKEIKQELSARLD